MSAFSNILLQSRSSEATNIGYLISSRAGFVCSSLNELNSKSLAFEDKVCYNCNKKPGLQTVFAAIFSIKRKRGIFYGKHYYQSSEVCTGKRRTY